MMPKKPSLFISLIPIILLIFLLGTNVWLFGDNTLSGSNQLTLLFSAAIAALLGTFFGVKWEDMLKGAIKSISSAMGALIILLLIGFNYFIPNKILKKLLYMSLLIYLIVFIINLIFKYNNLNIDFSRIIDNENYIPNFIYNFSILILLLLFIYLKSLDTVTCNCFSR